MATLDDTLLIDGLIDDDDLVGDDEDGSVTPALAQVLGAGDEGEEGAEQTTGAADDEDLTVNRTHVVDGETIEEISLEEIDEPDGDDEDEQDL